MVATVQSENYNFFSRRIGYAIGGFNVISRISEIGSIYSKNKKFDLAVWNEIIHNWEVSTTVDRNKPSDKETSTADHTANFYYYLDVFRKDERIITPLSTLETLGTMANAMDHEKYLIAAKLFIFSKIIENDGDYYANLLLSNFDSKEFYKKIEANFEHKQQILLKYFKNYNVQKNVKDALSMRVQGNFKDEEVIYKKKLENIESKIIPPRKSWSNKESEIYLFDTKNKKLTELGERYLKFLKSQPFFENNKEIFVIWPKYQELTDRRILIKELKELSNDETLFFENLIKFEFRQNTTKLSDDNIFEILILIFKSYKNLYGVRSMLRNQISSNILKFIFYSYISVEGFEFYHLDNFIEKELKSSSPRLNKIILRGNNYGITFK